MRGRQQQSPARWQTVPTGMRDFPPPDVARRNVAAASLREDFFRWGYREVRTPVLEYLETLVRGAGPGVADQLFKSIDADGSLLALRPEMTVPIARLAATRLLQPGTGPVRLAYLAEVFRGQEAGRGRLREFTQAGVELLGIPDLAADAEVIALAAQVLQRLGVPDALLHVGHLGFLNDLLSTLEPEDQDTVRVRLYRKEFALIDEAVADPDLAQLLRMLPELHGPEAMARAREFATSARSRAALDELDEVMARIGEYGLAGALSVDLSLIRDFSYYTGIVFEGYGGRSGYPLLGGGRYDRLLARFGMDAPATGFALGLDRVLDVLPGQTGARPVVLVVGDERDRPAVIRLAGEIRSAGIGAVTFLGSSWPEGIARARREGYTWMVQPDGTAVHSVDLSSGQDLRMSQAAFLRLVGPSPQNQVVVWTP